MAQPDDFTVTLLHTIQDQRTTPQGGWLSTGDLHTLMGLNAMEGARRMTGPLLELFNAGMIERRFNAAAARDEYRSRGVQPAMGPAAHEEAEGVADPTPINEPLGATARGIFIYLHGHPGFVVDTDLMHALSIPTVGLLWAAMAQLEAAGLTQRRLNNGRAVRLHPDVRAVMA